MRQRVEEVQGETDTWKINEIIVQCEKVWVRKNKSYYSQEEYSCAPTVCYFVFITKFVFIDFKVRRVKCTDIYWQDEVLQHHVQHQRILERLNQHTNVVTSTTTPTQTQQALHEMSKVSVQSTKTCESGKTGPPQ